MSKQKPMDLTGHKYGKLLVIGYSHNENGHNYYNCLCDCTEGQESREVVKVNGKYLREGSTSSCGCLKSEKNKKIPKDNRTQVFSNTELKELPYYHEIRKIYKSNIHHCNDSIKEHSFYKKGLSFCTEWSNGFLGFLHFYIWCIDNGYIGGKSQLDRIDKNKGFSPKNCKIIDKPIKKSKESKQSIKQTNQLITKDKPIKSDFCNPLISTSDDVKIKLLDFLNSVGINIY